jgi:hypothetical protein
MATQVLLDQMVAGTRALFLEKMQNAAGELRLQAAGGEISPGGGSFFERAGPLAIYLHDHSPNITSAEPP